MTPIVQMLLNLEEGTRFCMPGHKGRDGFLPKEINKYDITELKGADNLMMPTGVIKQSEELHAKFIGAKESFFLVNGSTCGIIAALLSVLKPRDKVLVARDFHISLVHALILGDIIPIFVTPTAQHATLPCVITEADVKNAIDANPDAKAVFITYPSYYGLCMDIRSVCEHAHNANMLVVGDGAHGSNFDFSELLPLSLAQANCDIWVQSTHKTLQAMNQCAVLNINDKMDGQAVKAKINLVQTTSPSYILLAAMDFALNNMRINAKEELGRVIAIAEEYIIKIEALGGYVCANADIPKNAGAFDRDILKLIIDVTDRGLSGIGAKAELEKHNIYVETADMYNIVLLLSVADTKEDFDKLLVALNSIKGANYNISKYEFDLYKIFSVPVHYNMRYVEFAKKISLPIEESIGEISGANVGVYPPGTPIIVQGQKIIYEQIEYILKLKSMGYEIFGMQDKDILIALV